MSIVPLLSCATPDPGSRRADDSSSGVTDTGDSATDSGDSLPPETGETGETGETAETGETGDSAAPLPPCGTLVGATQLGGPGWEMSPSGPETADGGRVIAIYLTRTSTTLAAGTPDEVTLDVGAGDEVALVRYDADGGIRWLRTVTSSNSAWLAAPVLLSDGGVAVVGAFESDVDIAAGESNHVEMTAGSEDDSFVARFSDDGTLVWARHLSGDGYQIAGDVLVLSDDSLVIAGGHTDEMTLSDGEPDATLLKMAVVGSDSGFLAKYDGDGGIVWAKQIASTGYAFVNAIDLDPMTDDIVAGGDAREVTYFAPGEPDEETVVSDVWGDGFVARYDLDGAFVGVVDTAGAPVADLAVGPDGGAFVAGAFTDGAVLGAGGPHETTLSTGAGRDAYVARFDASDELVWVASTSSTPSGSNQTYWRALALDGVGGVVATGGFSYLVSLGKTLVGDSSFTTSALSDMFSAHYDASGAPVCGVQFGGRDADEGDVVTLLSDGTYEIASLFYDTAVAAKGTPEELSVVSEGKLDTLFARYAF